MNARAVAEVVAAWESGAMNNAEARYRLGGITPRELLVLRRETIKRGKEVQPPISFLRRAASTLSGVFGFRFKQGSL